MESDSMIKEKGSKEPKYGMDSKKKSHLLIQNNNANLGNNTYTLFVCKNNQIENILKIVGQV